MELRIKLSILITIFISAILIGCTREMTSDDERPRTPFSFDRIPAMENADGQVSTGSPEIAQVIDGDDMTRSIEALMDGGRNALLNGNLELAIEYFSSVIEQDENYTKALYNLGHTYRQMGDFDKAVEFSLRAVESNPDELYVHQNLAYAYESQGNMDDAILEFEEELIRHPDEPRLAGIASKLALIYLEKDLHQDAFDAAIRAVTLEPEQSSHHALLADVHMKNRAYEQAIESYQKAVTLDPEVADYRKRLADALWSAGREDDARLVYGEAIDLDPEIIDDIPPERLAEESDSASDASYDAPM